MRLMLLGSALLLAAAPAVADTTLATSGGVTPAQAAAAAAKETPAAKKASPFDMAQMMAVFDKIFPAQPDPLPARLALSRTAVKGLFPDGTYARMMNGMMSGVVDRVMGLSEADLGMPGAKGKPASTLTMRQKMMQKDPYFEERMRITQRVIGEEMAKIATIIEPKVREGLARSMARRFDEKQLADIDAFLATDSGRAFGSQSMAMWIDPDVMRSVMTSFPDIMTAMPGAMKRIETETAHLPKPKKDTPPKKKTAS
jgi:hypothetical protein